MWMEALLALPGVECKEIRCIGSKIEICDLSLGQIREDSIGVAEDTSLKQFQSWESQVECLLHQEDVR